MTSLPSAYNYEYVILTTMKDEGPYLLDWVAHHLSIGFTHIVVLTNDCSDGTEKICRNLEKIGILTHAANPAPYPRGIQKTAYQRMRRLDAVQNAKWLMPLDVDEYLRIDVGDGQLEDLFREIGGDFAAISFMWQIFGNADIRELEDKPTPQQFTKCAAELQLHPYHIRGLKTLYQQKYFAQIGTHRPLKPIKAAQNWPWLDANGVDMPHMYDKGTWMALPNGIGFGNILGRVNHYALRSRDAFYLKWKRGFVNRKSAGIRGEENPKSYWQCFNWNIAENSDILKKTTHSRIFKNKLLEIPKIQRLHDKAFEFHKDSVTKLKEDKSWIDEIDQILDNCGDGTSYKDFSMENIEHPWKNWQFRPQQFSQVTTNSILDTRLIERHHQRLSWT